VAVDADDQTPQQRLFDSGRHSFLARFDEPQHEPGRILPIDRIDILR